MNPSTALARVLVDALVANGVRELVLAPGSRSAPVALAALRAAAEPPVGDRTPTLRLHVRIDERSAGFLALGLAKATNEPVVVLTTSGSAVANLHPAVLEAHHAGVPLMLLTADRPPELRGVGANQTTDQVGLFGSAVRLCVDVGPARRESGQVTYWRDVATRAIAAARGTRTGHPGPVHLNVALSEPLLPDADDTWVEPLDLGRGPIRVEAIGEARPVEHPAGPRTVVLAGDGATRSARELAESAGWPLLAEPSSGARGGPNAIGPYRLLLDTPGLGTDIERVVVFGHPTLSRPVTRLLAREDVEVVVVAGPPNWADPARRASLVTGAVIGPPLVGPEPWLDHWTAAAVVAERALDDVLAGAPSDSLTGPAVARAVGAVVERGWWLVVGSSSPIRDLDLAMRPTLAETAGRVLANRGLSGIDGTVSTAVGAALAIGEPTVALLGDLTFLHDANGLVIGPDEPRPDLTIVVVNDDGGGLFHLLEQGAEEHVASFERVFGTPHGVDLAALCAATRTPHATVRTTAQLESALAQRPAGIAVVQVPITRTDRRALHERIRHAVEAAVADLRGSTA